eukprot:4456512-Amphidinium_carterae.2
MYVGTPRTKRGTQGQSEVASSVPACSGHCSSELIEEVEGGEVVVVGQWQGVVWRVTVEPFTVQATRTNHDKDTGAAKGRNKLRLAPKTTLAIKPRHDTEGAREECGELFDGVSRSRPPHSLWRWGWGRLASDLEVLTGQGSALHVGIGADPDLVSAMDGRRCRRQSVTAQTERQCAPCVALGVFPFVSMRVVECVLTVAHGRLWNPRGSCRLNANEAACGTRRNPGTAAVGVKLCQCAREQNGGNPVDQKRCETCMCCRAPRFVASWCCHKDERSLHAKQNKPSSARKRSGVGGGVSLFCAGFWFCGPVTSRPVHDVAVRVDVVVVRWVLWRVICRAPIQRRGESKSKAGRKEVKEREKGREMD